MYCDLDDIKERIPEETIRQLTDDYKAGSIDQAKVDAAIERADKEIDAWCGSRYSVPFSVIPDIVKELSADIAVYHLYARKTEKIPETREDGRKNAVALLKEISKGVVSLGVDPAPASPTGGGASFVGNDRQMTRDKLRDM